MPQNALKRLPLLGVAILIAFLAYGSQILFRHIEPYALEHKQTFIFNALVACIWITYTRACFTDPGWVPSAWTLKEPTSEQPPRSNQTARWCKKCEMFKPPRAHHCKTCRRCIPKMDHHCPWTGNCVSYRTFPHFLRFLFYATGSMIYLEYLLYLRLARVWAGRSLPSYLGPSLTQLVFLFIIFAVNSITLFALAIILGSSIWSLAGNMTTIEGSEMERHETLVRRARSQGGYLDGPDGTRIKIRKQEFPYDIGILPNMRQGMGGSLFGWLWPFMATPMNESGLQFDTNGFEDPSLSWPPPDPDRIPRSRSRTRFETAFVYNEDLSTLQSNTDAFHRRKQEDLKRYDQRSTRSTWDRPLHQQHWDAGNQDEYLHPHSASSGNAGKSGEGWRDSDGDRLDDLGVDEDAGLCNDDETPLAELIRRRHDSTNRNGDN